MGREGVAAHSPAVEQQDARMGGVFSPGSREAHWLQMSAGGGSSPAGLELPKLRLPPISSFMAGVGTVPRDPQPTFGHLGGAGASSSVQQEQQQAWHLMCQKAMGRTDTHHSPVVTPSAAAPPRSPQYHGSIPGAPPSLALAGGHHAGFMPQQVVPTPPPRPNCNCHAAHHVSRTSFRALPFASASRGCARS